MRGARVGRALLALAVVAAAGGEARADRLIVVEPYSARDAVDEGAAVGLLLRSMFSAPGLEVVTMAATDDRDGTIEAAREKLGGKTGWVVVSEVARRGTGLRASVRLVGGGGEELGATTVVGGDGAVTELAKGAARFIGPRIGHMPLESPTGSVGTLRAYARAATAPPGEAARLLAAADPRVAGPVAATREIAARVWKDEERPIDERMDAALVGLAQGQAIEMADDVLAHDPKNTHAAAIKARALIGSLKLDDAAAALAGHAKSKDPAILLARAELAHFRRDPEARDEALAELLAGEVDRAALGFIATLPPGTLDAKVEARAVAVAPSDDPRLASALGLRAVLSGSDRERGLGLLSARELDDREARALGDALGTSDVKGAARVRAELAMRRHEQLLTSNAVAEFHTKEPTSPLANLYRGRERLDLGDLTGAATALGEAKGIDAATLELARVLARTGRFGEAEKLIADLQAGDTLDGMMVRAQVLLTQKKAREALAILRQAEGASPANPEIQEGLAAALTDLGQKKEAGAATALAKQLVGGAGAGAGANVARTAVDPGAPVVTKVKLLDESLRDLASVLTELLAAFPSLPTIPKVVLVPLEGNDAPWWSPRRVASIRLREALELTLTEAPFGIIVVAATPRALSEPLAKSELVAVAEATGAQGVVLYGIQPDGGNGKVKLVLFDAVAGVPMETTGTVPGDGGLVGWNRTFFTWTACLLAALLAYGAYITIRGVGELNVRIKLDPEARDDVLSLIVSKSSKRPVITDPAGFREAARALGHRVRRRRGDLVGPHTRIRRLPPGDYHVHLYGVLERGGEAVVLDERWSRKVEIARGKATPVMFDMVPTHADFRLRLLDGGEPVKGGAIWFAATPETRYTIGGDELRLELALGEHELHIEAGGIHLVRPLNFSAPSIERMAIQLDRERRIKEISGDTSFLTAGGPSSPTQLESGAPHPGVVGQPPPARRPVAAGSGVAPSAATVAAPAGSLGGAVPQPSMATPIAVGQSMLGRYDIVQELGRGAMGIVLKARDQNLDRDVALKIISDELRHHPEALKLFLQEGKALAQLNHPNIVAVYDQSQHDGQAFMVMEFVDGNTLEHVLTERGGKLPVGEALTMLDQLFAGLAYAHDRRVIHRDIKPANIFVSSAGVVKIGDFGLARVMRELSLRKTEIRGTPLYMAPEQITGTNVGHRADLYAAGCTAFELLTGRPPFIDGDIMYHHIHSEPPRPSSVDPALPHEIDALVMKCIVKEADERFDSAHAVRERLRLLLQRFG